MFLFSTKVTLDRTTMQVRAMMAQQCRVYTHGVLCDHAFVNLKEFFCVRPVHVKLGKEKTSPITT